MEPAVVAQGFNRDVQADLVAELEAVRHGLGGTEDAYRDAADVAANIPPFLDKPRHVEMRKPLSSAFFAAFDGAQDWIDPLAETHLARLAGQVVVQSGVMITSIPYFLAGYLLYLDLVPTAEDRVTLSRGGGGEPAEDGAGSEGTGEDGSE